ncbi:Predicted arabinose efflux permease, MFS family [Nocardioides scoriae]|uniref:Predicted arabinose efflux permease, MFS family n=2 Tax=Nocardioides scoriae TaxID=642780 RepID=A0A1H1PDH1_9ACTN|nr:Predicted arabinose efflux permease, MFS family [Nocardioides scoriae]
MADTTAPTTSSASPARDRRTDRVPGRTQGVLLMFVSCLPILGAVLLAPVLPSMQDAFAGTPGVEALVPVTLTIPALMIGLLAPFAGGIVDRFGRTRLLVVALVVYAAFGTAPLWLDGLPAIVLSRAGVGVTEAAIMTCCTTLIADYFSGAERDRWLGLQTVFASVSATVFFAVGGGLGAVSWRAPFWLYASSLVFAVLAARLLWTPTGGAADPADTGRPGGALPPVPWRSVMPAVAVTLFGGVVFYTPIVELPFALDRVGVTAVSTIGAMAALASAATAVGAFTFGRVAGRGTSALLPVAFGLAGLGLVLMGATDAVAPTVAGAVLASAGTGLMLPTLLVWAITPLGFQQRGRGTGLWTAALFIGEFLCPLLVLALTAVVGGLGGALVALGVAALAMAAGTRVGLTRVR